MRRSLPAEGAGGDVADRHVDDPVDPAVGRDADDAAAAVARVPEIAVAVHGRTVRLAAVEVGEERPLVGDRAGGAIVVPDVDRVPERVAAIEELAVGAPAERVGDADAGLVDADGAARGDPVELAGGLVGDRQLAAVGGDVVLHRADPKVARPGPPGRRSGGRAASSSRAGRNRRGRRSAAARG